jgi:hypothetical protein
VAVSVTLTPSASNTRLDFYANAAAAIATARKAALTDPEGQTLDRTLAQQVSARA